MFIGKIKNLRKYTNNVATDQKNKIQIKRFVIHTIPEE